MILDAMAAKTTTKVQQAAMHHVMMGKTTILMDSSTPMIQVAKMEMTSMKPIHKPIAMTA